jgi:endonuclease/exonuclease/phosphatase family metal-dependent hydrolase
LLFISLLIPSLSFAGSTVIEPTTEISVMTFNVRKADMYGWEDDGTSWYNVEAVDGNDETHGEHWVLLARGDAAAQSILDIGADIVGLQEYDRVDKTAKADIQYRLEERSGETWYYADPADTQPIVSRFPIVEVGNYGVRIQVSDDHDVWIFNKHFGLGSDWNQSYIPYAAGNGYSESQILAFVEYWDNWGSAMTAIRKELDVALASDTPVFFTGDFNEPSHLDWTPAAVAAGYIPLAVACPLSMLFTNELFMNDGYHQDRIQDGETEVSRWGYTWTSDNAGGWDDDRIDFVYYSDDGLEVLDSAIVGDANIPFYDLDDVDLKAWWDSGYYTVSDHRGVVVRFLLPTLTGPGETGTTETGSTDTGVKDTGVLVTTTSTTTTSTSPTDTDDDSNKEVAACGCQSSATFGLFGSFALLSVVYWRRFDAYPSRR